LRSVDCGISPSLSGGRSYGARTGADRANDTLAAKHLDRWLVRAQVVDLAAPLAFRAALLRARPWQAGLRPRGQHCRPNGHGKLYQSASLAGRGPLSLFGGCVLVLIQRDLSDLLTHHRIDPLRDRDFIFLSLAACDHLDPTHACTLTTYRMGVLSGIRLWNQRRRRVHSQFPFHSEISHRKTSPPKCLPCSRYRRRDRQDVGVRR
jgi:hypothetical protein